VEVTVTPLAFARRKGSYGLDAPYLLPVPAVLAAANLVAGAVSGALLPFVAAALIALFCGSGLYTSRRGKFVVWAKLLDQLDLRGDECILDLGCGRGAVLLMAAQHLTSGRAVGVDIWRSRDQSGNSAGATQRNALAEGVADRVQLYTADMTALPFADNSFDLVLSSIAIHNIAGQAGRDRAIEEAVRVLRPGGRLVIADLRATGRYCACLWRLGLAVIDHRSLGWQMWWGGPWAPTRVVIASKQPA
jgi:arsenite methyltransferase